MKKKKEVANAAKKGDRVKTGEEDLLSDRGALSGIISEGERAIAEDAEKANDVYGESTGKETKEEQDSQVKVYSNNPDMKWYIVYVRTSQEQKAKEQLERRIKAENREKDFANVLVPTEKVIEIVKGKKKTSKRKFFPGYMLVQMIMNEETWHFVKSTPRIVGFIGSSINPPQIDESEVLKITSQVQKGATKPTPKVSFEEGETVRVIEGPFTNFTGIVEEVKPDKAKLRVFVSIFGRSTPVELEFIQVEKI